MLRADFLLLFWTVILDNLHGGRKSGDVPDGRVSHCSSRHSTDFWLPPRHRTNQKLRRESPKNASTLSSLDEDGVANDCYLWNASGQAPTTGIAYDVSYPYPHQGQVHFDGSSSNPLESQIAAIQWDMRTLVDTTNPAAPTAVVNYNHTCYPSHQIKVNGKIVYSYTPSRNDVTYIFGCLVTGTGKIVGQQTTPIQVPPY